MISKKILFLVEGSDMEASNVKNIAKNMFHLQKEEYQLVSYGTSIYELYDRLYGDSMLSLVGLLKEMGKLTLEPGELSKQAFSQIYLVFDFDPQYQKYTDEKIRKLLDFFQDETENGKIYINYPMFESAFYIDDFYNPSNLVEYVRLEDCFGERFKKRVREITCFGKKNHINLSLNKTEDIWFSIKWNYIKQKYLTGNSTFIDYKAILEKQIEIKNCDLKVFILSTFVLMIIDYNPGILSFLEKQIGLN